MSVEFHKLWTASTTILPEDNMMLGRLLRCLDEELVPLLEWSEAAELRTPLSELEIYRYDNYHRKIMAIAVFREELMVAPPATIGFLYGQSVQVAASGLA